MSDAELRVTEGIQWDELEGLLESYPVWPGSTISHASMDELKRRGFAVRDASGNWIPTAAGIYRHLNGPRSYDRGVQR